MRTVVILTLSFLMLGCAIDKRLKPPAPRKKEPTRLEKVVESAMARTLYGGAGATKDTLTWGEIFGEAEKVVVSASNTAVDSAKPKNEAEEKEKEQVRKRNEDGIRNYFDKIRKIVEANKK